MIIRTIMAAAIAGIIAGVAVAEPVDGRTARNALFNPNRTEVAILSGSRLSEQDAGVIRQVGTQLLYYAAIAISPDEGILSNATIAAADHHAIAAAETAALAACNAARTGAAGCVIVAHVRPRGWQPGRAVQLGASATRDFRRTYGRGGGPRALAISPATGRWAIVKGDNAGPRAIEQCNARAAEAGATDCNILVSD